MTERVIARLLEHAAEGSSFTSEPHHIPCRPIGKDKHTGPECRLHHQEWHGSLGLRGHARKYRVNLPAIRAALAHWLSEQAP